MRCSSPRRATSWPTVRSTSGTSAATRSSRTATNCSELAARRSGPASWVRWSRNPRTAPFRRTPWRGWRGPCPTRSGSATRRTPSWSLPPSASDGGNRCGRECRAFVRKSASSAVSMLRGLSAHQGDFAARRGRPAAGGLPGPLLQLHRGRRRRPGTGFRDPGRRSPGGRRRSRIGGHPRGARGEPGRRAWYGRRSGTTTTVGTSSASCACCPRSASRPPFPAAIFPATHRARTIAGSTAR